MKTKRMETGRLNGEIKTPCVQGKSILFKPHPPEQRTREKGRGFVAQKNPGSPVMAFNQGPRWGLEGREKSQPTGP